MVESWFYPLLKFLERKIPISAIFSSLKIFREEKFQFPPYFSNFRKVMKYTCFPKIPILRGPKLSRITTNFRSEKRFEEISTYIFLWQNFIPIRPIVFARWASQNRKFSKISKTRVFHQLSENFQNKRGKVHISAIFFEKFNFLGQHTPKVRKNWVFKNGIFSSNRAF